MVFTNCLHYFCKRCLIAYTKDVIMRGDLQKLICPNFSGCVSFLTESNLRQIGLPLDIIEKFNTYSVSSAIDSMKDFTWCPIPECAQPAELDLVKNYGRC